MAHPENETLENKVKLRYGMLCKKLLLCPLHYSSSLRLNELQTYKVLPAARLPSIKIRNVILQQEMEISKNVGRHVCITKTIQNKQRKHDLYVHLCVFYSLSCIYCTHYFHCILWLVFHGLYSTNYGQWMLGAKAPLQIASVSYQK